MLSLESQWRRVFVADVACGALGLCAPCARHTADAVRRAPMPWCVLVALHLSPPLHSEGGSSGGGASTGAAASATAVSAAAAAAAASAALPCDCAHRTTQCHMRSTVLAALAHTRDTCPSCHQHLLREFDVSQRCDGRAVWRRAAHAPQPPPLADVLRAHATARRTAGDTLAANTPSTTLELILDNDLETLEWHVPRERSREGYSQLQWRQGRDARANRCALHCAVLTRRAAIVRCLLRHGAGELIDEPDAMTAMQPLHVAAFGGAYSADTRGTSVRVLCCMLFVVLFVLFKFCTRCITIHTSSTHRSHLFLIPICFVR